MGRHAVNVPRLHAWGAAVLFAATGACGAPREAAPGAAIAWPVDARPLLRIGEGADGEGAQYRLLSGVRLLDHGGLIVASDATKQLFLFDSSGALVRAEGRSGKGPGEFLHLSLLPQRDAGSTLYDAIQRRLSHRDDATGPWRFTTLSGVNGRTVVPRAVLRDGALVGYLPGDLPPPSRSGTARDSAEVVLVAADGRLIRSLGRVAAADRVLRQRADGGLTGGEPPYGRELHLAATDEAIVVADGGHWELTVHPLDGRSADTLRLALGRRAVTEAMRVRYRARVLDGVRDAYGIAEWTMLSTDDVFPDSLAAFDRMLADREGLIWLRASVAEGDHHAQWFVVDARGQGLSTITLDAGFTATDITRDRIAGIWRDADGWEEVRVYRFRRAPD